MQRRMFIRGGPKRNRDKILFGEPDAPALIPPDIFVGETVDAQKERDEYRRVSEQMWIDLSKTNQNVVQVKRMGRG